VYKYLSSSLCYICVFKTRFFERVLVVTACGNKKPIGLSINTQCCFLLCLVTGSDGYPLSDITTDSTVLISN